MKKLFLSALAVFAFATASAQSDTVVFGVKGGLQVSTFQGDGSFDSKTGFYIGGLVDLPIAGNFHIQPELLYSMEGADGLDMSFVRIPIMAKYYIIENLSLQAGPQLGFRVNAEDGLDDVTKSFDAGISGGAGYEFPFGLFVDARVNVGLVNISDISGVDMTTHSFMVGAGYRF